MSEYLKVRVEVAFSVCQWLAIDEMMVKIHTTYAAAIKQLMPNTGDGSSEDAPLSDGTHVMGGGGFASALDRCNGNR